MGKDWELHIVNIFRMIYSLEQDCSFYNFMFVDVAYPPFFYWVSIIIRNLSGGLNRAVFFTPMVFFIVLILSVYGIGKKLKNQEVGILAAIICSFFPIIYEATIQLNHELASVSMGTLAIYSMLTVNEFRNVRTSLLLGLVLGFSILTRIFVVFFLIGPFFMLLLKNKWYQLKTKNQLNNILIVFSLCIFIAGMFYYSLDVLKSMFSRMNYLGKVENKSVFSIPHLIFYFRMLPRQIGWWGVIWGIVGINHLRKENSFIGGFLVSWILLPLVVMTLVFLKHQEYTMGFLPAIAISIALWIDSINNDFLKKFCGLTIIIIGCCQYFRGF